MGLTLHWGVKQTFREYVSGLPDGVIEVSDGAELASDGFLFPSALGEEWEFRGAVRFRGHEGLLDVTIADPRIELSDGGWAVYVSEEPGNPRATATRFARLRHDGMTQEQYRTGKAIPVALLTTLGSQILGGVYSSGTELDRLRLVATG